MSISATVPPVPPMEPLSIEQIDKVLKDKKRPTQFYEYKDLPANPGDLSRLLLSSPQRFLFFTASSSTPVGHWTAMRRIGPDICWFSSYGFLPDGELMISADQRAAPGQHTNKISKALDFLQKRGYTIHYSTVPLQSPDDGTVSCGIWCLMFLTARINNFEEFERRLASISIPEKYARAIYNKQFLQPTTSAEDPAAQ